MSYGITITERKEPTNEVMFWQVGIFSSLNNFLPIIPSLFTSHYASHD